MRKWIEDILGGLSLFAIFIALLFAPLIWG
jgi:hypothetical protein